MDLQKPKVHASLTETKKAQHKVKATWAATDPFFSAGIRNFVVKITKRGGGTVFSRTTRSGGSHTFTGKKGKTYVETVKVTDRAGHASTVKRHLKVK
jgi:L-asparaginase II